MNGSQASAKRQIKKGISGLLSFGILAILILVTMTGNDFAAGSDPDIQGRAIGLREVKHLSTVADINAVTWNKDGTELAALSNSGADIQVWDTKSWTLINEFHNPNAGYAFNSLAFTSDGHLLTAPKNDVDPSDKNYRFHSFVEWDVASGKIVRTLPGQGISADDAKSSYIANTFAVSGDGALIAGVKGIGGVGVVVYDVKNGSSLWDANLPRIDEKLGVAQSIAFAPNNKEIAVGAFWGELYFYGLDTKSLLRSFSAFDPAWYSCGAVAYSSDGKYIAAGRQNGSTGHRVDGVWRTREANIVSAKVFDIYGNAIADLHGTAASQANGKEDAVNVRSLSWAPNRNLLAVGDDQSLRVWRIVPNDPILLLDRPLNQGFYSVAFSPEGMLAAANKNEVLIFQ